eukprot:TRINITY_DN704_c0_g1_i4.p1 TRINITY_DN704_c0_g1~~TRINITY_DN704_c0_g1_i4.p1  ORF type:complete len:338 (+),score=77.78 TRINITY_DN704_c0_g1_i4:204-1217(+)
MTLSGARMYPKGKSSGAPSDAQAREKLALYVYEYLLHVGAQKAAQTFLNEIRWEKNITLGEPPGFLHSWWCVFWDLYCAAPERRDTCDHSSEAKAFHDYGFVNSGYSVNGLPPHHPGNPMMAGGGMPPRMTPPRGPGPMGGGPMGPYGMRGPPPPPPGHMAPMGGRPPWPPTAAGMSPGGYPGPPSGASQPGSSTPIMPSPQDSNNSSGDNMYTLMKPAGGGNNMPGDMCGGPPPGPEVGGPLGGPPPSGPPGNNGGGNGNSLMNGGDALDNMKSSPAPGTPRGVEESGAGNLNEFGMGPGGTGGGGPGGPGGNPGGGSFGGGEVVKNVNRLHFLQS